MGKKLIEEGTMLSVTDEEMSAQFVRWFEYGFAGDGESQIHAVILMGDGRVRQVPVDKIIVQTSL